MENGLRVLQLNPVNVVARSHLLVLWSRLGPFDRADLDTLLWRERWLFEYWTHAAMSWPGCATPGRCPAAASRTAPP
ncbi:MAG TPA: crosslink repair DNA glycosylase YcaQ family protein [Streptosporangiaceae bacterium]